MHAALRIGIYTAIATLSPPKAFSKNSSWLNVEIGVIGAASDDILSSALKQVERQEHRGLIITLDTPGGSLEATRSMVKQIMNAQVPVVVWVGPDGARAASAGTFITLSAHIAAMAAGTNIGAASPIQAGGKEIESETVKKKVEEDTLAFIESIAERRQRNVEMARSFVLSALSITASEALKNNVIDLIANSRSELLAKIDNKTIKLGSDSITLTTSNTHIETYEPTIQQSFLQILSNPNLFYLLFLAGLIGLGFELTHPGSLFPGIIGGICMILALISTAVLPVSFGAMILVLAGVALMVVETFVPSFGILGVGGFAAFVIGSFLLVDPANEQGLRISWLTIIPGALTVALTVVAIGYLVLKAERSKTKTGAQSLLGKTAYAVSDFQNGQGQVKVQGEIWRAKATDNYAISNGDELVVNDMEGLNLLVAKKKES